MRSTTLGDAADVATGRWLDLIANRFRAARLPDETDDELRERLVWTTLTVDEEE